MSIQSIQHGPATDSSLPDALRPTPALEEALQLILLSIEQASIVESTAEPFLFCTPTPERVSTVDSTTTREII
jgi:hypothetical protein